MRYLVSGSTRTLRVVAQHQNYAAHLGFLLAPANRNSIQSILDMGLSWAADNGAYSGFDAEAFRRMVRRVAGQPGLMWVVCPDVVADAPATLALYREWEPELRAASVPVAYVLQDGQDGLELPTADCYFIGGSTAFKLSEAARGLVAEGKQRGATIHMGRVNSLRRLYVAHAFGADTVDGSSASKWGDKYIWQYPRWIKRVLRESALPTLFERQT